MGKVMNETSNERSVTIRVDERNEIVLTIGRKYAPFLDVDSDNEDGF